MSTEEDPGADEHQRRAANLWYDRFERKRQERGLSPGRQRLVRWLLLGAAATLLVLGLRLRGDRFRDVLAPRGTADGDKAAQLSRELQLDEATGAAFFPVWEEWRRGSEARAAERAGALATLDELSRQRTDMNGEQERLMARLGDLEDQERDARRRLLEKTQERLGLWRAARLQVLMDMPADTPR